MRPTDKDIEAAYLAALRYANRRAPRPDDLNQCAIDAATDGIMWALEKFDPALSVRGFGPFAAAAVERHVWRAVQQHARKYYNRPEVGEIAEEIAARDHGAGAIPMPAAVADLPEELRSAVRFFYLDRFTLRECGLLLGMGHEKVRRLLQRAAAVLGDGFPPPSRANGEKRIRR